MKKLEPAWIYALVAAACLLWLSVAGLIVTALYLGVRWLWMNT